MDGLCQKPDIESWTLARNTYTYRYMASGQAQLADNSPHFPSLFGGGGCIGSWAKAIFHAFAEGMSTRNRTRTQVYLGTAFCRLV